jgi:branched-chain amino acid transport system permease protein
MDLTALGECAASFSCLVTQSTAGLIAGLLLFLVASGLTLVFGVLGFVNFVHGSFYMIGAYFAYTTYSASDSYMLAIAAGGLGMALFGMLFEKVFVSRVYGQDVLLQILLCYAFILIFDDLVDIIWGHEFISMGIPAAFQVPPLIIAGGVVPPLYLFLISTASVIAIALAVFIRKTLFGHIVRAAAENRNMVASLGINTGRLFTLVFGLGALLAGLSGALAAPVRSLTPGMGFSILIESFIVTVIGGLGSIGGAFVASIVIGLTRSFGSVGFPLFTEGLIFAMTALVLLLKPSGLFGRREV